ncbi:MAG: TolC family protein, partial [Deltaproteobacteria bacterium]|nr:TolC family protein [Deltaproteobacteria bacterium]
MVHLCPMTMLSLALVAGSPGSAAAEPEVPLTPRQAVQLALEKNLGLQFDRLDPALTDAAERMAAAAFEPTIFSGVDLASSPAGASQQTGSGVDHGVNASGDLGVRKVLGIGTTLEGNVSSGGLLGSGSRGGLRPTYQSGLNLSARQPLLQGASSEANLAAITTARLERRAAEAMLRRRAELVAADTLRAYWDLRGARAKVAIQRVALQQSEKTLAETEALIAAGKLASSERASAAYGVEQQRRALLRAEQELADVRDRMARLLGLVAPQSLATPPLVPVSNPRRRPPRWTLEELQRTALAQRGDFQVLLIENELVRLQERTARHRLLPRLDLVAGVQFAGLSEQDPAGSPWSLPFDRSYWSSWALGGTGWSAGLVFDMPLGNGEARARRDLAALQTQRAE